jgi:hypothetical protein
MRRSAIVGRVFAFGVAVGFGVAVSSARNQAPSERVVGGLRGNPLVTLLPYEDTGAIESAVLNATRAAGVLVGIERVIDEPLPQGIRVIPRSPRKVTLTGMRLSEALSLLTEQVPPPRSSNAPAAMRFTWKEAGGMILVSQLSGRHTFLDTVIESFDVREKNVRAALRGLYRRFDPDYPEPPSGRDTVGGGGTGSHGVQPTEALSAPFNRPLSVSLKNVTAREVLSTVVAAAGEMSWVVRYSSAEGRYEESEIMLAAPGPTNVMLLARRKK